MVAKRNDNMKTFIIYHGKNKEIHKSKTLYEIEGIADALLISGPRCDIIIEEQYSDYRHIRKWHGGNNCDHALYKDPIPFEDGFYSDWKRMHKSNTNIKK